MLALPISIQNLKVSNQKDPYLWPAETIYNLIKVGDGAHSSLINKSIAS